MRCGGGVQVRWGSRALLIRPTAAMKKLVLWHAEASAVIYWWNDKGQMFERLFMIHISHKQYVTCKKLIITLYTMLCVFQINRLIYTQFQFLPIWNGLQSLCCNQIWIIMKTGYTLYYDMMILCQMGIASCWGKNWMLTISINL